MSNKARSVASEIGMHFRWTKRATLVAENVCDDLPLNRLRVDPDHGILSPVSIHYFSVTAECEDLPPNIYSGVLQLYVEDIPLAAIPKKLKLQTEICSSRRRKTLISVDVWIADVEVRVQHTMDDESKINAKVGETLEESVPESTSSYDLSEKEDAEQMSDAHTEDRPSHELITEEFFSHYDIVDLKQFEPLLRERIVGIGIIRPTRFTMFQRILQGTPKNVTLYIGIEETYVLSLKNLSDKSTTYSWGEANGSDIEMMKFCVCPRNGALAAKNTEKMKISVVPIKQGIVQFLHVPCYVGNLRKIIILGIECSIEPLYVTFHFPRSDPEVLKWKTSFTKIEWRVDSLKTALNVAAESKEGMKVLDKYKMQEERELMNTDLDQGDVLKDASVAVSGAAESGAKSSSSTRTSEIIKLQRDDDFLQDKRNDEEEDVLFDQVVQFSRTTLPPSKQPVIEFLNLSLRKVEKKTFIIKNETAIPSNFWISIKNFYPIWCSCEKKLIEDRIRFIFKQAFGGNKNVIEESLCQVKQTEAGVVIYVDPLNSDLDPFEAVPVDIYVFADTWGTYIDELDIRITGLPRYTLAIRVEVIGSPISLSIEQKNSNQVPVLDYGREAAGNRLVSRKVLLKNTSVLPIAINWHVFLVEPTRVERIPFNIAYDVCTPFTDELSKELKKSGSREKSESQVREPIILKEPSKIRKSNEFIAINTSIENLLGTSSDFFYHKTTGSWAKELQKPSAASTWTSQEKMKKILRHSKYDEQYSEDDTSTSPDADEDEIEKKEDIEFGISILPYYGEINNKVCTVTPREMFMLPKHNDAILISVHPDKCISHGYFHGEFVCKVLGLLRIAPSDKYRNNQYSRVDGLYLPPIEFNIKAVIVKPQLLFNISKADRTFTCCINDVMQTKHKRLELKKTFFFCNNDDNILNIILETYEPFYVKSTSIYIETNPCKPMIDVCINGHGCAEVEIICNVNETLINTILHTSRIQEFRNSIIVLKEPLFIIHSDNNYQEVELTLQICLPSLKLSSYMLDFGTVYIGDTKKLILLIENLSTCAYKFKMKNKCQNKDFTVDHKRGKLLSKSISRSYFTLTISFHPKKPGPSTETLQVITDMPYNIEECELSGEATLDEKFHRPGE